LGYARLKGLNEVEEWFETHGAEDPRLVSIGDKVFMFRYGASLRTVKGSYYWDLFLSKRGSGFWFGRPVAIGFQALLLSLILKAVQRIGYYSGH